MASEIDVGDAEDIYPKYNVGERLARWALSNEYGQTLEPSGPLFREVRIQGLAARVRFGHVGSGLMIGSKVGRTRPNSIMPVRCNGSPLPEGEGSY